MIAARNTRGSRPARTRRGLAACAVMALALVPGCATRGAPAGHPAAADAYLHAVEALAALQSLNVELLTNESATLTLTRWCAAHRLADPARVVADRDRSVDKPATAAQRELLGVGAAERIAYRRVKLRCGDVVLSEADNWYVPSRLTPGMNELLETTDVAFGRAVESLGFVRQRLGAELLWQPLPDGWDVQARPAPAADDAPTAIPAQVLHHSAVLKLPDGRPISLVDETYTSGVLASLRRRPRD
jgi:chorismate-pyruvate lyase